MVYRIISIRPRKYIDNKFNIINSFQCIMIIINVRCILCNSFSVVYLYCKKYIWLLYVMKSLYRSIDNAQTCSA